MHSPLVLDVGKDKRVYIYSLFDVGLSSLTTCYRVFFICSRIFSVTYETVLEGFSRLVQLFALMYQSPILNFWYNREPRYGQHFRDLTLIKRNQAFCRMCGICVVIYNRRKEDLPEIRNHIEVSVCICTCLFTGQIRTFRVLYNKGP